MQDLLPAWAPDQKRAVPDHVERAEWLGWFDIPEWVLREISEIYSATFRNRRPNDPRTRPRVVAYHDGVRAMRERLIPPMWLPDDRLNRGAVVSQDGRFALRIRSGDKNTGFVDRVPRTWLPLSSTWHDEIAKNQLLLSGIVPAQISKLHSGLFETTGEPLTLMLLIYDDGKAVRVELAVPNEIRFADEERFQHVGWWLRLLILGGDAHQESPMGNAGPQSPSGQMQGEDLSLALREQETDVRVQPQTPDHRPDEAGADQDGVGDRG